MYPRRNHGTPYTPNPEREKYRSTPADDLVAVLVAKLPSLAPHLRVVGRWVWCEFEAAPPPETRDTLRAYGFSYSARRHAWMNPCGVPARSRSKVDPRMLFDVHSVTEDGTIRK